MEKVLFLTAHNLFPVNNGGAIFSLAFLCKIISSYGENVEVFCPKLESVKIPNEFKWFENLNCYEYDKITKNERVFSLEIVNKLSSVLNNDYDIIVIDGLYIGEVIFQNSKKIVNSRIIFLEHNVEYINYYERYSFEINFKYSKLKQWIKKIHFSFKVVRFKKYEIKILKFADSVYTFTEKDANTLMKISKIKVKSLFLVPLQTRVKYQYYQNKKLLILGSMWWYPNIEGTLWFVNSVFNKILEYDPSYKLYIVGSNPTNEIIALNSNNIIITGNVESVDEYIEQCDLLIVPNHLGTGLKVKILEGMLKGIPVLTTVESVNGYSKELIPTEYIFNSAEDAFDKIIKVNESLIKKNNYVDNFIHLLEKIRNDGEIVT